MSKRWRVAVIGTSVVGHIHIKALANMPNAELAAVCDLSADRAKAALERHGITGVPIFTDQKQMHEQLKLDVVTIATPSGAHLPSALMAIEHGVNVIVEKPLEIRLERIDQILNAAKAKGVKVAYISQNRWGDANRALKQAAVEGRFGRVAWAGCFTPWFRSDEYYAQGGWRGTWNMDGGGAAMNQSIHAIDILQWIAGDVKRVAAFASSRIHEKIEVEDTLSATLTFANGSYGSILATTAMWPGSNTRIEIGGEFGTAVSEAGLKTFTFKDARPSDKELVDRVNAVAANQARGAGAAADIAWELHFENFKSIFGSWDKGEDAETSGAEGRKAVAIITAMYESAKRGGEPVEVK